MRTCAVHTIRLPRTRIKTGPRNIRASFLGLCSDVCPERPGQTEQYPSDTEHLSRTGYVGSTSRGGAGGTVWELWYAALRYTNVNVFYGDVRFVEMFLC
jgi:hypothetical protein